MSDVGAGTRRGKRGDLVGGRTFDAFAREVRESCEKYAKSKGYTENEIDGENKLSKITALAGIATAHGIGEIIYKAVEYLKNPRKLLLVKIAGWCFILWRQAE